VRNAVAILQLFYHDDGAEAGNPARIGGAEAGIRSARWGVVAFQNRFDELAWLPEGWGAVRAELRILYGRRRVGKSPSLDELARGKRHIVLQAGEGA
jgi:hypothetical protein